MNSCQAVCEQLPSSSNPTTGYSAPVATYPLKEENTPDDYNG